MKHIYTLMILSCSALSASAQLEEDITKNIENRVNLKDTPSIVVGIIENGEQHVYVHGKTAFEGGQDLSQETIYEIGSISKVFTSLLFSQAVIEGKMSLDETIQAYLPAHITAPQHNGKEITLLHLATHRSGLPGMPDNYDWSSNNPYIFYDDSLMLDYLNGYTLTRNPGESYEYSNYATGLLGYLVAKVYDTTYENLFKSKVSVPLRMTETTITLSPTQQAAMALGHANGKATSNWDFDVLAPAGAWRSTAIDMLVFMKMQMGLMETNLTEAIKLTQAIHVESNPKMGLGWHYYNDFLWHNGGTGGFRSFCGIDLENQRGIIVLSNSESSVDDIGLHFLDESVPLVEPKPVIDVDEDILKDYHGLYSLSGIVDFNIYNREDGLYGQLAGQDAFKLYSSSKTFFFLKVVDAQVEFFRNEVGEVSHLILYQNGMEQKAVRKD